MMVSECTRPPEGWHCTRIAGHDGPCAAHADVDLAATPDPSKAAGEGEVERLSAERDAAIRECSKWAAEAGEAKGRLEMSEAAGIVEGWRDRALKAEADLATLAAQPAAGEVERVALTSDRLIAMLDEPEVAAAVRVPGEPRYDLVAKLREYGQRAADETSRGRIGTYIALCKAAAAALAPRTERAAIIEECAKVADEWRPIRELTNDDGYVLGWSERGDGWGEREYFIGRLYDMRPNALLNEVTGRWREVSHWTLLTKPAAEIRALATAAPEGE